MSDIGTIKSYRTFCACQYIVFRWKNICSWYYRCRELQLHHKTVTSLNAFLGGPLLLLVILNHTWDHEIFLQPQTSLNLMESRRTCNNVSSLLLQRYHLVLVWIFCLFKLSIVGRLLFHALHTKCYTARNMIPLCQALRWGRELGPFYNYSFLTIERRPFKRLNFVGFCFWLWYVTDSQF